MLRFFRGIRRKLLGNQNFVKYTIYAIGEILLVVIGILIALQVNNWNQDRQAEITEKKLLTELMENLNTNEERLQSSIEEEGKSARSIVCVVESLEAKRPYRDTMDQHFGRVDYAADIVLSTTAFETIKSRGFDIILSDDIRKSVINLFDAEYGILISETVRLEDQFWPNVFLPAFHRHFRLTDFTSGIDPNPFSAYPVDYPALLQDEPFISMLKHRGAFRFASILQKRQALEQTKALKKKLGNYLVQ